MAPAAKIQYPTRAEWEHHKAQIVRLYVTENMRLDDVRQGMEREHNFKAKNRMYKTRFKSWGIYKNNPEAIMAALVRNIQNRKAHGKRSLLFKNNKPFSRAKIASHLKKKGMTADQLLRKVPSDASMPSGFTCVTPPHELQKDTPSSDSAAVTPPKQTGLMQTPPTSGDSGFSRSGHVPTPRSPPNETQVESDARALAQGFEAMLTSGYHSSTLVDPFHDFGPDLFETTGEGLFQNPGQGLGNISAGPFSHSSMIDITGEALFLTSPGLFPPSNDLDLNLHMSMSSYMQNPDCYQPLHCRPEGESQRSLPAPSDPQPEVFVSFCYLSCILHGQGQEEEVSRVTSEAFKIYQTLIKQEHEQALACLNLVLAVLFMYGQRLFAVELLKKAHQAALCHHHKDSPIIVTINFMVQQASRTVEQCGITHARLRVVYDDFRDSRTLKHPYTILAGYHLAWRLASDGVDGLEQACHLLFELEAVAEHTFGKAHMQTIAILTTKARVLHDLKHYDDAEKLMSEAIKRIEMVYPPKHPYALEAKRRYSILLYAVNNITAAEQRLIEVALGRVEVLGPRHKFSEESMKDVEEFLCAPGRETELDIVVTKLSKASAEWDHRNSSITSLQFW